MLRALTEQATRPAVCPMLDETASACRVYEYRPVACRTYGFYVQHDLGLYCIVLILKLRWWRALWQTWYGVTKTPLIGVLSNWATVEN